MSNVNLTKMQELLERMETSLNDYERANAQLLVRAFRIMNDLLAKHLSLNVMASEHFQDAGTKECRFCRIFFESNELPYHPDIKHTTEYCYYVPRDKRRSLLENEGLCPVCFYPGHNADACPANIINCKYCYGEHNHLICTDRQNPYSFFLKQGDVTNIGQNVCSLFPCRTFRILYPYRQYPFRTFISIVSSRTFFSHISNYCIKTLYLIRVSKRCANVWILF